MNRTWAAVAWTVLIAVLGTSMLTPHGRAAVVDLARALRDAGPAGMAAYAGIYCLAVAVGLPMTWSAAVGGWLYGGWLGALLSFPGCVLGTLIGFLVGRTLLRDVAARLLRRPRLAAVDQAVAEGGWRVVALLRMAPLAQNMLTFTLGATRLRTRDFVVGSAVGSLPALFIFGHAGALAADLSQALATGRALGGWAIGLAIGGVLALLAASLWIARRARAALLINRRRDPA